MNRKIIVSIIVFILILAAAGGGYYYYTNLMPAATNTDESVTGSLAENETIQNDNNQDNNDSSDTTPGSIPKLRQITTVPVAGYDFVDIVKPKGYVVWYVERSNGHVSQASTSTLDITRITNTTIPKVYEAHISKTGSNIILRTLNEAGDRIQTFIGSPKAKPASASSTDNIKDLSGIFTSDNITQLSLSPLRDKFFGVTATGLGNTYTFAAKSTNIFSHPLKKWVPQWVNVSTIVMTSAPSAKTQNISYFLNPANKAFSKLIGPKNGLVVSSSPTAAKVLYSENRGNKLSFGVFDVKTGTETQISTGTIPDKCVWSKKDTSLVYCGFPKNISTGIYPDDWYQGKILFNDTLRSFDVDTYTFDTVSDLETAARTPIDATNLVLSGDEKYILFTNKADLTLWMLEL